MGGGGGASVHVVGMHSKGGRHGETRTCQHTTHTHALETEAIPAPTTPAPTLSIREALRVDPAWGHTKAPQRRPHTLAEPSGPTHVGIHLGPAPPAPPVPAPAALPSTRVTPPSRAASRARRPCTSHSTAWARAGDVCTRPPSSPLTCRVKVRKGREAAQAARGPARAAWDRERTVYRKASRRSRAAARAARADASEGDRAVEGPLAPNLRGWAWAW